MEESFLLGTIFDDKHLEDGKNGIQRIADGRRVRYVSPVRTFAENAHDIAFITKGSSRG